MGLEMVAREDKEGGREAGTEQGMREMVDAGTGVVVRGLEMDFEGLGLVEGHLESEDSGLVVKSCFKLNGLRFIV